LWSDIEVSRDNTTFKEGPASLQVLVAGGKNNQFMQVKDVQNNTNWMHFEKEVDLLKWTTFPPSAT
jgi:hypothetical protein